MNSYKRLVPGYEAPVYICWAQTNRSALIRVPPTAGRQEHSRRTAVPDPSCNPYLAFAAMLAAGLDGVERGLQPPDAIEENVYEFDDAHLTELGIGTLPGSLSEALDELEQDSVLQEALGATTYRRFVDIKRAEWQEYRRQVTPWEMERYLESL